MRANRRPPRVGRPSPNERLMSPEWWSPPPGRLGRGPGAGSEAGRRALAPGDDGAGRAPAPAPRSGPPPDVDHHSGYMSRSFGEGRSLVPPTPDTVTGSVSKDLAGRPAGTCQG